MSLHNFCELPYVQIKYKLLVSELQTRLVQTSCIKHSGLGCFGRVHKNSELEKCLSQCVLFRSERAITIVETLQPRPRFVYISFLSKTIFFKKTARFSGIVKPLCNVILHTIFRDLTVNKESLEGLAKKYGVVTGKWMFFIRWSDADEALEKEQSI